MSWSKVANVAHVSPLHQPGDVAMTAPVAVARFNRDGDPIGYLHWTELVRDRTYRLVATDYATIETHRLVVHTRWTGVSADSDVPVGIFETSLFANDDTPHDGWFRKYDSIAAAVSGHADVLDDLRAGRWPA
ncbi:hypothetical protein ACJEDT_12910 [Rhodococcoides fascians]|uniref:hypothetical protein n=1 Tax=Rhodococcoides fascians TaxID=1828 RepID=UPI00389A04E8